MNLDAMLDELAGKAAAAAGNPEHCDYVKDGLLYCGQCDTAKQCRVDFGSGVRIVCCQCACDIRREEAERRARQDRERRIRARAMRSVGVPDGKLASCRFDAAQDTPELQKCRRYADNWDEMKIQNSGLLLWGNTGNGKTFAAACIVNALIDRGIPAMITSFPRILASGMDKQDIVCAARRYPLLVLDDLGAERSSEYALETVYMVIDERYKAKKPLIVTTNMTLDDLCRPKNMRYQRIYDRVLEMCVPVVFRGDSMRRVKAQEKLHRVQEILDGRS